MKKGMLLIALTAFMLLAAGCEKEEFACSPVYGRIYCKTSNPKVGQEVVLTVEVNEPGNRINSAEYRWKCNNVFDKRVKVIRESGENSVPDAPELTVVFNESGTYTINLSASFKYSMGDKNTSMIGSASATGRITINP